MSDRHSGTTMTVAEALRAQQPTAEFMAVGVVPLRPDIDAAHAAGLRLLEARERDIRRAHRRHDINLAASLCVLLSFAGGIAYGFVQVVS